MSISSSRRRGAFDCYRSVDAQALLRAARARFSPGGGGQLRVLATSVVAGTVVLAGGALLAILAPAQAPLSLTRLALVAFAFLVAMGVRFPVGSGWTRPTQIVFVPMLFLVPTAIVPLLVAGLVLVGRAPSLLRGRRGVANLFAVIADAGYALAPAAVLILAGRQHFAWRAWPVLVGALAAQFALDICAGLARSYFADGIRPSLQLPMAWVYLTDTCLSCVGVLVAASARHRPAVVLLTLPLLALLGMFAREREQRLDSTLELSDAYRGTATLLGEVIEADDEYTGVHSRQVVELALEVAQRLGLNAEQRLNVELGALLHDVGKIRVPAEIIGKRGPLDEREWEVIRGHTLLGEQMLNRVGGTLARVGRIVRASHERYDGAGYPDGLVGEGIPIEARIICACDAFDAIVSDRPYRRARGVEEALAELARCAGSQFDPQVVAAICTLRAPRAPAHPHDAATLSQACAP